MAAANRQPSAALSQFGELIAGAESFGFAAALRLIECAFRDAPRLGQSLRPGDDPVRLAQDVSMAFPPGPLAGFEQSAGATRFGTLRVRYPGLFGPNGALPLHLTEYVIERIKHHEDFTFRDFVDIFHHRLLSLYWRAISSARPVVHLDRPASDRFGFYLGSLAGFGAGAAAADDTGINRARRHWAGHFARPVRNTEGLEALLGGFFGAEVRVQEFAGRWIEMPGGGLRLGRRHRLGQDSFLGESLWDCSQSVRIVIGPVDRSTHERLLPCGESWGQLRKLVDSYVGAELGWEVQLVLRHDEVPDLRLGRELRLGWTSWLLPPRERRDAADLILRPDRPFRQSTRLSAPDKP